MTGTLDCKKTLQDGSKGSDVKLLQENLQALGYYLKTADGHRLVVDGNFSKYTYIAVRAYQGAKGLYVDGIVGEKTCTSINNDIAQKTTPPASSSTPSTTEKSNVTKTAVTKDPYTADTTKNIYSSKQANLIIDGINLIASNVTPDCNEHNGNWKQLEMLDGHFKPYLGHDTAYTYTVETVLKNADFEKLSNEFFKMGGRICNVVSTELNSGRYLINVKYVPDGFTHQKVTLKFTEDY